MALIALVPAAMALLKLISWISGIVLVGSYVRDAVVKTKEADVQISTDETVENILNRSDLTAEEKSQLINKYLGIKDDNELDLNTILVAVVVVMVLLIAFMYYSRK
ncbi:MAG: hypothetical protein FIB08_07625 [Candidatus Methanoperedens sp.]|nr:hypothetical protein [Candidatus Methanoperedens sp.]